MVDLIVDIYCIARAYAAAQHRRAAFSWPLHGRWPQGL